MSLEFLNPCRGIIETDISLHARMLRTSFAGKLKDAFFIFAGKPAEDSTSPSDFFPYHVGVFDFLTLGIPGGLFFLGMRLVDNKNSLVTACGILALIISFPFLLARILVSAGLVFNPLSLLVIGAVHLISQYPAGGAALKKLVVEYIKDLIKNNRRTLQIQEFERYTEDQLAIDCLDTRISGNLIYFDKGDFSLTCGMVGGARELVTYTPSIFREIVPERDQKFEAALLKLNCGNLAHKVEDLSDNTSWKELLKLL